MKIYCPICGKKVEKPFDKTQGKPVKEKQQTGEDFFPFCSKRCKLIDLNSWFDSEYVIKTPLDKQKNNNPDKPENMLK